MSLTQLKQAAANLPVKKQRELIAYLVARQTARDDMFKKELAARIDDRNPAHWMELNAFSGGPTLGAGMEGPSTLKAVASNSRLPRPP